ncbi:hypothetical protein, partial [Isoptericola haloaureus]
MRGAGQGGPAALGDGAEAVQVVGTGADERGPVHLVEADPHGPGGTARGAAHVPVGLGGVLD